LIYVFQQASGDVHVFVLFLIPHQEGNGVLRFLGKVRRYFLHRLVGMDHVED
jgi:hypothetical protein